MILGMRGVMTAGDRCKKAAKATLVYFAMRF